MESTYSDSASSAAPNEYAQSARYGSDSDAIGPSTHSGALESASNGAETAVAAAAAERVGGGLRVAEPPDAAQPGNGPNSKGPPSSMPLRPPCTATAPL